MGENNIKMNLKEVGQESVGWIHLEQDWDTLRAAVNTVTDLLVK